MAEFLHETLNIFFPQWQGSGRLEMYEGAKILYELLDDRISFTQIPTSLTYSLTIDRSILGYSQIFSQLLKELQKFLVRLRVNFDLVGFSVLEFLPTQSKRLAALEAVKLLDKINIIYSRTSNG